MWERGMPKQTLEVSRLITAETPLRIEFFAHSSKLTPERTIRFVVNASDARPIGSFTPFVNMVVKDARKEQRGSITIDVLEGQAVLESHIERDPVGVKVELGHIEGTLYGQMLVSQPEQLFHHKPA